MKKCRQVLCCLQEFGTLNQKNRELLEEAKRLGMEIGC